MAKRRKHNRIEIPLHVRLGAISKDKNKVLDLTTKNISYTGAFIPTLTSFPKGTRFNLDFTLPTDKLQEFMDPESLKGCTGRLVRSTPQGFAIQFDKECQIEGLKAL